MGQRSPHQSAPHIPRSLGNRNISVVYLATARPRLTLVLYHMCSVKLATSFGVVLVTVRLSVAPSYQLMCATVGHFEMIFMERWRLH